jgi:hypothetical protein
MVQNFDGGQMSESRIEQRIKSRIEGSRFKNRDKQMPFIVRVIVRFVKCLSLN